MVRVKKTVAILSGVVALANVGWGQFETAEVLGTVRDASGAIVRNANVTLLNQDTGIERKALSDDNGQCDFFNVKVGRWTDHSDVAGFSTFSTKDGRKM